MSENIAVSSTALTKARLWLFVGLGLLLMAIANWHLVYMAITSEPACVTHVRQGEGTRSPVNSVQHNLHARRAETGAAKRQRVRR